MNINIHIRKRVLILFLLFFGLTVANLSTSIFTNTSEDLNNEFVENITNDTSKDLGRTDDTLHIASYSNATQGTSPTKLNVSLQESILNEGNPLYKIANFNSLYNRTFSIDCPKDTNFNSSFINITVQDIYALNKTLYIENNTSGTQNIWGGDNYFSFTVKGTCYLTGFSICLDEYFSPDDDDCQMTFEIYSSVWQNSRIEPNTYISGSQISEWIPNGTNTKWFNYSYSNLKLDASASKTYDKTFFIRLYQNTITSQARSRYHNENNGVIDDSIVYKDESGFLTVYPTDPSLKIRLRPLNNTPAPTQIGLKINSTAVINATSGNKGYWSSKNSSSSTSGKLNFTLTANWWDIKCNISRIQVNYTKTDLRAIYNFSVVKNDPHVQWTVNITRALNDFGAKFKWHSINFTIPDVWDANTLKAWNKTVEKTINCVNNSLNNGYRKVVVRNAGNGTWYLTVNSTNLVSSIKTAVDSVETDVINFIKNIDINATFTDNKRISNGNFNLTVSGYDLPHTLNFSKDISTFTAGSNVNLAIWDVSNNVTQYGPLLVQVFWKNNTMAGFREKMITILANTQLSLISPANNSNFFKDAPEFNVTVYFNDTGKTPSLPITPDEIQLQNDSIVGGLTNNGSLGYYYLTVKPLYFDLGLNTIKINASKHYYNNKTIYFDFTVIIHENTQLSLISPTNSSYYFKDASRFNITVYFNETEQNVPISADKAQFWNGTQVGFLTPNGTGSYYLTVNPLYFSIGPNMIKINASKQYYDNKTIYFNFTVKIHANANLSLISPPNNSYYFVTAPKFNITVFFNDTDAGKGPLSADKVQFWNGTQAGDFTPNGSLGYYYLTINPNFYDFGWKTIRINASKQYYDNKTIYFLFHRVVTTKIGHNGTLTLGSVMRGFNQTFTFNYTDTLNNPISGADWTPPAQTNGFEGYLENLTSLGFYKLHLNTSKVTARVEPYYYNFTIYKSGKNPYRIDLRVTVLLPRAQVLNFTNNIAGQVVNTGANITIRFRFLDAHNRSIINIFTNNITVKEGNILWNRFDSAFPNGGYLLINNGTGNYTLKISTLGLTAGNRYVLMVNISYYSPNPGPYNYTIITLNFYYSYVPSGTTNGGTGGGGGGGGGGGTTIITPPANVIFGIPVELFYLILSLIVIGIVTAIGSVAVRQKVFVPRKLEKARALLESKTIFDDAINLEHVLVLYRGTGMCIFFKSFGTETIDPELISGFLSAVSSFGREMESQESLNEITYGDKTILLSDGEFTRVALVLAKKASIILRKHLQEFINAFEKTYQEALPNWRGQLNVFRNAGEIINDKLNTSIILPHRVSFDLTTIKTMKYPLGKEILNIASELLKDTNRDFLFIATLLAKTAERTGKDNAEIFMAIKELREKRLLNPFEISTIETSPITQKEIELLTNKVCDLTNLSPEECQDIVNELSIKSQVEREAYFVSLEKRNEIVSIPIKSKAGITVIDNEKSAKKEIAILKDSAKVLTKEGNTEKAIEILENASSIAKNWELNQMFEELQDLIRTTTIASLNMKYMACKKKANIAYKEGIYGEAAQKYKQTAEIASSMFKLGVNKMMNEVKRLTNKSKECEKLK